MKTQPLTLCYGARMVLSWQEDTICCHVVVGTMGPPGKSPSIWVQLPELAGIDWIRHLPCLWFRACASALSRC